MRFQNTFLIPDMLKEKIYWEHLHKLSIKILIHKQLQHCDQMHDWQLQMETVMHWLKICEISIENIGQRNISTSSTRYFGRCKYDWDL